MKNKKIQWNFLQKFAKNIYIWIQDSILEWNKNIYWNPFYSIKMLLSNKVYVELLDSDQFELHGRFELQLPHQLF